MIAYRIAGYTNIYTNHERLIHVLNTRHKDKKVSVEVFNMDLLDKVNKDYFLTLAKDTYDYEG